ncbi:hypothetical protein [Streptomyces anulatus]
MTEQQKAAAAYKAGAANRDPQAVKTHTSSATRHGSLAVAPEKGHRR